MLHTMTWTKVPLEIEMVDDEPIYEYVPGQGWVVGVALFLGKPCQILDLRKDRSSPGIWRYEIWLVGVKNYNYPDWVDRYLDFTWKTLEDAKSYNEHAYKDSFYMLLFDAGMKQRFVNRDSSNGDYMQDGGNGR